MEDNSAMKDYNTVHGIGNIVEIANKEDGFNFGSAAFDLNEIEEECKPSETFMKTNFSLSNTGLPENKSGIASHFNINKNVLKPFYFQRFTMETLFYIFYFMPTDTLQIFAANELYSKGWTFNTKSKIWFLTDSSPEFPKEGESKILFFHPLEWKAKEYNFEPLNPEDFLKPEELSKYKEKVN